MGFRSQSDSFKSCNFKRQNSLWLSRRISLLPKCERWEIDLENGPQDFLGYFHPRGKRLDRCYRNFRWSICAGNEYTERQRDMEIQNTTGGMVFTTHCG